MASAETHKAIETVWRIESARLIGGLARLVRDLDTAEELAQDALVAALEQWPDSGIPRNPGAWLMAAAKHRAIDRMRRERMIDRKLGQLAYESESHSEPGAEVEMGDDVLRLIFAACHPVLPAEARVALTLRVVAGLSTAEIARAFLTAESTMAQRIVRAKRMLAEQRVRFEIPEPRDLPVRLPSVLEVVYLIFNEGYAATAGEDWIRPALCEEALRLGRTLAALAPEQSEVHGLLALMEIQASRNRARLGPGGAIVRLADQNRALWDRLLIHRGLAALDRAYRLSDGERRLGPYGLQAAIAACHARARSVEETDWGRIVALYGELAEQTPSPVVELNRAVAVSMASGPEAALGLVDELMASEPGFGRYHLLHAVRGDLLERLGRSGEAREAFRLAASLTENERERELLEARAKVAAH